MANQKTYRSKVHWLFIVAMQVLPIVVAIYACYEYFTEEMSAKDFYITMAILSILFVISYYFINKTFYFIKNGRLYCQAGPIKRQLDISSIESIRKTALATYGIKMALGLSGLSIYYNGGSKIFISPAEEEEFKKDILNINPDIIFK